MFRKFPYTNFHDLNLDWIIRTIKDLLKEFGILEKKTDDAIEYMKDNINDSVVEIINQYIQQGLIDVAVNYTEDAERLDIIVTEGGNE